MASLGFISDLKKRKRGKEEKKSGPLNISTNHELYQMRRSHVWPRDRYSHVQHFVHLVEGQQVCIFLFSLWVSKFLIAQTRDCKQAMPQDLPSPNSGSQLFIHVLRN
jgi:hypothetical protein